MAADLGPGAVVGWLRAHPTAESLAGCAFLIGPNIVLTCAHVIGAHLGLAKPVPNDAPTDVVTIRFEALQDEVTGHALPNGWFSNPRPFWHNIIPFMLCHTGRIDRKNKNRTKYRMKTAYDLMRHHTSLEVLCGKCSNSAILNNCFLSMHQRI